MFPSSGARVGVAEKRSTSRSAHGEECHSQRLGCFFVGEMLLDGHNTKDKRRKASKVVCLKTRIIFVGVAAALILAEADGVQVRGLFFLVNVKMDRKILVVVKSFLKNQRPPPPSTYYHLHYQTKKKSWRQYVSSSGPNRMEQKKKWTRWWWW
jgi:hypothetical protein